MDNMLDIIPGKLEDRKHNVLKVANLDNHLVEIKKEFIGKPFVCYKMVEHIIKIRRKIDVAENIDQFTKLLHKYNNVLLDNLDIRWLISICDTLADFGDDNIKPRAMLIVNFLNMIKLSDTRLALSQNPAVSKEKIDNFGVSPLWGGLTTFDIKKGDMVRNMMNRINKILEPTPILKNIYITIFKKVIKEKNLFTELEKLSNTAFYGSLK